MNIEIHQPEIEALIQQRLEMGGFHDVEEVLLHALRSAPLPSAALNAVATGGATSPQASPCTNVGIEPARSRSLEEVFAMVRGLADDLDFGRDPSPGRPVDLS